MHGVSMALNSRILPHVLCLVSEAFEHVLTCHNNIIDSCVHFEYGQIYENISYQRDREQLSENEEDKANTL